MLGVQSNNGAPSSFLCINNASPLVNTNNIVKVRIQLALSLKAIKRLSSSQYISRVVFVESFVTSIGLPLHRRCNGHDQSALELSDDYCPRIYKRSYNSWLCSQSLPSGSSSAARSSCRRSLPCRNWRSSPCLQHESVGLTPHRYKCVLVFLQEQFLYLVLDFGSSSFFSFPVESV